MVLNVLSQPTLGSKIFKSPDFGLIWTNLTIKKSLIPLTLGVNHFSNLRTRFGTYGIYGIYLGFMGFMGFIGFIWDLWDSWDL